MYSVKDITNPFGAPVYYRETVSSTMDESRLLAAAGEPGGTVIAADFQEAGRGRTRGRSWTADRGKNLFFTILLRYPDFPSIPRAITLRTGLALSLAVEDFAPALAGMVLVKWPNDLMLCPPAGADGQAGTGAKTGAACKTGAAYKAGVAYKAAGILTEGDGETVFIGIGVNVAQTEFPESFRARATSIQLALQSLAGAKGLSPEVPRSPLGLLEKILARLYRELVPGQAEDWRPRLEERLYLAGREVSFVPGAADAGRVLEGHLAGIGPGGELRIIPRGEAAARSFVTGELRIP
ncbi:MAG: biotin--[acetyl-CoA-carboxylase] ligase family protein [Spirochaetaceae bacterium]|jgi:BirA family biotin operon repressor/biotin-[acetyl-CoA-carboxylase] ligase|nr:biotin--[acetyl-CoA-carboxylase] ligase family protein [Spirochaetaceae bacterium]